MGELKHTRVYKKSQTELQTTNHTQKINKQIKETEQKLHKKRYYTYWLSFQLGKAWITNHHRHQQN